MDRLYRLLFDPNPADGGVVPVAATPAQTPAAPVAAAPATPATTPAPEPVKPPEVTLSWDEAQRLFAAERKLRDADEDSRKKIEVKEQEKLLAMAKAGESEKALEQQRTSYESRLETLTNSFHGTMKLNALADATAVVTFASPEAAAQARALMAQRLEVRPEGDSLKIVDKATGRPVAEAVKGWLESAEFRHFQAATTKGGSGAGNSNVSPANPVVDPNANLSWADRAIAYHQARNNAFDSGANPYDPIRLLAQARKN